jgi:hypothetical protein
MTTAPSRKHETVQQYIERISGYSAGQDGLALQESAPAKVAALISGRTREELTRRPAPDKWSVAEIIAHLADAEVAIAWRLRQILSTNAVQLQAYDQDAWANTFRYADRDPQQSLEAYRALRAANVLLLKTVPRELWNNYGMHAERGKETITHTVQMVAGHDINHLKQIEAILNL